MEQQQQDHGNSQREYDQREYDKTGFYPPEGKAFRVWALLAWLAAVIVALVLVSMLINIMVLG
ncbi:MAG: hypothetical protein LBE21_06025 [Pseudomonadales bacterium]|jgi:hypothetical protein|nr:hypothetical protein [Pseudomonadales bacterium]